jgi:hypothetical protein
MDSHGLAVCCHFHSLTAVFFMHSLLARVRTPALAIFVLGFLSALPLFVVQLRLLWGMEYLRFFPLAWLAFLFFVIRVPKIGFAAHPVRRVVAIVLAVLATAVSLVSGLIISSNLAQLAILLYVCSGTLLWLGIVPWTRLVAFWSLLWVTWPLPGGVYGRLLQQLQTLAVFTASNILDTFGVIHFATAEYLDLRSRRIEMESLSGSYDSVYTLFFLALLLCICLRRPLLLTLAVLAAVPIVSWLGTIFQVLLAALGGEWLASDWTQGYPLLGLRVGVFLGEMLVLYLISLGLLRVLEPVMVDREEQLRFGIHSLYNRLVIWPMDLEGAVAESEESYFDEPHGETAAAADGPAAWHGPTRAATRDATDPWLQTRWGAGVMAVEGLALACSLAAVLLPAPSSAPLSPLSDAQVQSIAVADTLPSDADAQFVSARVSPNGVDGSERVWVWDYGTELGALRFMATGPTQGFGRPWEQLQRWQVQGAPRRVTKEAWPVYEVDLVGDAGKTAYAWYSAFDMKGESFVPANSFASRLWQRLNGTLIGRLLGVGNIPQTYQTSLFLEANDTISETSKVAQRARCALFTKAVARKTLGTEP